jgi:hypothetical protein
VQPGKQLIHEALGEALGFMKASKQKVAEYLQDGGPVEEGERQEPSFASENPSETFAWAWGSRFPPKESRL